MPETTTDLQEKKLPSSTKNHLRMIRFAPETYAGIHKDMNLVIVFDDPEKRIIGFEGDQGTCKSSSLNCLKTLLGAEEIPNAINAESKGKKAELIIEKDGKKYSAVITKTLFSVIKHDDDGPSAIKSPKTFLRNLIGPVGINPMELKYMKGKEQITWLRELFKLSPEQEQFEKDLVSKKDESYKERTRVNAAVDQLKGDLLKTEYYKWDSENKFFIVTSKLSEDTVTLSENNLNDAEVTARFNEANQKLQQHKKNVEVLANLKNYELANAQNEVGRLELLLMAAKDKVKAVEARIEAGELVVTDGADVQKTYDDAFKNVQSLGNLKIISKTINDSKEKYNSFLEKEQQQQILNGKLIEYDRVMKEMVKSYTPEIEGLEVILPGIDPAKEEGLYFKGKTPAMLSESELFSLALQLWGVQGVKVAIIENITSLGTDAIEQINKFANEHNAYVFYSAMERGKNKLVVSFHDHLT